MRPTRLFLALVLGFAVLAGCGNDDEPSADETPKATTPSASDATEATDATEKPGKGGKGEDKPDDSATAGIKFPEIKGDACDVEVEVTGAVEVSWTGEGVVSKGKAKFTPPATYQAEDGDYVVTMSSRGKSSAPGVVFTDGGSLYGSTIESTGYDIKRDASGATADTDLADPTGGDGVHVVATFDC
ncbi:MAG: hypothetical protein WB767_06905 [Nocardioides sp.]